MTHGQFTITDEDNSQTLYTFHDGHVEDAVTELYGLMDYWVTRSADYLRGHTQVCPMWCDLILSTRTVGSIRRMLETPGGLENCYRLGIRYDRADAVGVARLMVARHWDRWFPYPHDYRGYPGDRFAVKLRRVGEGTMDYELQVEGVDAGIIDLVVSRVKNAKHPCLEFSPDSQLPTVHLGKQFWHAMRREIGKLVNEATGSQ